MLITPMWLKHSTFHPVLWSPCLSLVISIRPVIWAYDETIFLTPGNLSSSSFQLLPLRAPLLSDAPRMFILPVCLIWRCCSVLFSAVVEWFLKFKAKILFSLCSISYRGPPLFCHTFFLCLPKYWLASCDHLLCLLFSWLLNRFINVFFHSLFFPTYFLCTDKQNDDWFYTRKMPKDLSDSIYFIYFSWF